MSQFVLQGDGTAEDEFVPKMQIPCYNSKVLHSESVRQFVLCRKMTQITMRSESVSQFVLQGNGTAEDEFVPNMQIPC